MEFILLTIFLLMTTIEPAAFSDPTPTPYFSLSFSSSSFRFVSSSLPTTTKTEGEGGGGGGGGGEEDDETLVLVPSGNLILAEGDTAVLECHLRTTTTSSSSSATTTLEWINATTNFNMTTDDTGEGVYGNIKLTRKEEYDGGGSLLNMTIINLTTGKTTFICQSNCVEHDAPSMTQQMSINLSVISSDVLCTFENEASSDWTVDDKIWSRMTSSSQIDVSTCTSGFSDHTYGGSDHLGHYMIARGVTSGQSSSPNEAGNLTSKSFSIHNQTKCFHVFHRTCGSIDPGNSMTVFIRRNEEVNSEVTLTKLIEIPVTRNGESSWTETYVDIPAQTEYSYKVILSVTFKATTSDVSYFAVDDIRIDDGECQSDSEEMIFSAKTLPSVDLSKTVETTTVSLSSSSLLLSSSTKAAGGGGGGSSLPTTSSFLRSTPLIYTTSISTIPILSTKLMPPPPPPTTTTEKSLLTTTRPTTTTFLTSSQTMKQSELSLTTTTTITPTTPTTTTTKVMVTTSEDDEESRRQMPDDDDDDDESVPSDNSTGLAIGIILAIMVAGACTAAILYRRKRSGKKSTYITFGNPSYSREHLPVNDFGLDSPLTLSSNGYTVLA